MLQCSDPLLLPVLLRTRPLMGGLLNHLSTDPPGIITGILQLLQDRVLGNNSRVTAAVQYELWTDSALEQLATICTADAGAAADAKADADADADAEAEASGEGRQEHVDSGSGEDTGSSSDDADRGSESESDSDSEGKADLEATDGLDAAAARQAAAAQVNGKQTKQQQSASKPASRDAAAAAAAAQLVADAASAAHNLLLLLLTSPTRGLAAASPAGALSSSSNSSSSLGERRVLRLLQWLQPGHHPSHARILQAVAAAQPRLAGELLQGLSYQLEPKPCGAWLGCVAALGGMIAAAAQVHTGLKQTVQLAQRCLSAWEAETTNSSSSSGAGGSAGSSSDSMVLLQGLLGVPGVDDSAVKAAVRSCLPPVMTKVGVA